MSAPGNNSTSYHSKYWASSPAGTAFLACSLFLSIDSIDSFAGTPESTTTSTSAICEKASISVDFPTVYFHWDSMRLGHQARARLKPLIAYLKNHPEIKIRLIGSVDERRTQAYGLVLSGKWAEIVKKYLQMNGVQNPLQTVAYGRERPVCFEHNEDCWRRSNQVRVVQW